MAYSELGLTYSSDRLPALSGLAKQFLGLRKGSYLAGLWRDSFLSDLMWRPSASRTSVLLMPEAGRAPTWSWVSIDAKIWFEAPYGDVVHAFCTALDVICDPLSNWPGKVWASEDLRISDQSGDDEKSESRQGESLGDECGWTSQTTVVFRHDP